MINDKRLAAMDRIAAGVKDAVLLYDSEHVQRPGDGFRVTVEVGDKKHDAHIGVMGGIRVFNARGTGYRGDKAIAKLNLWLDPGVT